jgi:hypothetical protein
MTKGPETGEKGLLPILQLLTMVSHLDNYAVIVPGAAGYYVTHLVYDIADTIAWMAGYKAWYEEYTPSRLHAVAAAGAGRSKLN